MEDGNKDFKINTKDELINLLGRIYLMKSYIEPSIEWEAYRIIDKKEVRDTLFKILHDSNKHKNALKTILSNLDGFDIERIEMNQENSNDNYTFKHLDEDSIFKELIKNENFMIDVFSRIINHTDKDLIKSLWKGENSEDYFDTFQWLREQELYRINLLKPFTGTTERIV
jgi:hypothetical protein